MTRWLAILFCSIALCCSGTLAFAQLAGAAPQLAAQAMPDEAPDAADGSGGQNAPAPAEPAQPDMPFELPELFDSRLAALQLGAGVSRAPRHAAALLAAPFIEGPQRPPRGFRAFGIA